MQQERKVALVIQARLNSQRVPGKMVRDFAGDSLFNIALEKLSRSELIESEDIYVAVGETELLGLALAYPFNIFKRTQEGCDSTNDPNKPDSLTLLYEWHTHLIEEGYTHVVLVSACNPLLPIERIDEFYEKFSSTDSDGMFSVTMKHNFYWDKQGDTITDWKGMTLMNTRKVDPIYEGAHCLYGSRIDFIADECWMGNTSPPTPELFLVTDLEATDIDTESDFETAEVLYNHFKVRPAVMAKGFLDPMKNKTGRTKQVGEALDLAHDDIKRAIEIAFYEGAGNIEKVNQLIRER